MPSQIKKDIGVALRLFLTLGMALFLSPPMPAVAIEEESAQSAYAEHTDSMGYNKDNVVCLAESEYSVASLTSKMVAVTVGTTEYSKAAMSSTRPYIAFSDGGTVINADDPQLGSININSKTSSYVMKRWSASLSADAAKIVFSGYPIEISDFDDVYEISGTVGGAVSEVEKDKAIKTMVLEPVDNVEAEVIDLPELNVTTAGSWAASLNGETLKMLAYNPAANLKSEETSDKCETTDFLFNISLYKGYCADITPLSGSGSGDFSDDFLTADYLNSWVVDGNGYMWFISENGEQYFYGTSFFSLAENALNTNAVSDLSQRDNYLASCLATPLADAPRQACVASKYKGLSATIYYTLDIGEADYSHADKTISFAHSESVRVDIAYGTASRAGKAVSWCLNSKLPIILQAGPLTVRTYLSLGWRFDNLKFAVSFERSQSQRTTIDLSTGNSREELISDPVQNVAISGGFAVSGKCFATCEVLFGKVGPLKTGIDIASVDFGIGVSVGSKETVTSGCRSLSLSMYPFVEVPSVYDLRRGEVAKTGQPSVQSILREIVAVDSYYSEPFGRQSVQVHLENGVTVDRCTQSVSCYLTAENVSFAEDVSDLRYTGISIKPKVQVQDKNGLLLTEGVNYSVVYTGNTLMGNAAVTVRGIGLCGGSVLKRYVVKPAFMSAAYIAEVNDKPYTGKAIVPKPLVSYGSLTLKTGTDYEYAYSNNTYIGTAAVTAKGKGNYTGSKSRSFDIYADIPGCTWTHSSITNSSVKVTLKIKKTPAAPITRVRIAYGTTKAKAKSMDTMVKKTVELSAKGDTAVLRITGLKAGTKYYTLGCIGFKCNGTWYFCDNHEDSTLGYFTTASSSKSLIDEQDIYSSDGFSEDVHTTKAQSD